MPTICLNMIVKNEEHTLARCFRSVRPLIDRYVIVDTGSTDDTKGVIAKELEGIPGEVFDRPWVDFGYNRTEAIQLAVGKADFLLVVDADDEIVGRLPDKLPRALYAMQVEDNGVTYHRVHLFPAEESCRFVGVLHEFFDCMDRGIQTTFLSSVVYKRNAVSLRGASSVREKFLRDAKILEEALEREPENARHVFYLGQSWKDAGESEKAIQVYERCARMNGWDEERWNGLYQIAVLKANLGRPESEVVDAFLRAFENRPTRMESMWKLGQYLQMYGRHRLCYHLLKPLIGSPIPNDRLFLNPSAYRWGLKETVADSAFNLGEVALAKQLLQELVSGGDLPIGEAQRVKKNLDFLEQTKAVHVRCPPSMQYYVNKVLQGEYNVPVDDVGVALDIGANVGSFAIWASVRWPTSTIHCYEPDPGNMPLLVGNLGKLDRFHVHSVAVADLTVHGPTASMRRGKQNCGQSSLFDLGEQTEETFTVPIVSPHTLPDCDLLKIDTEGCEVEIAKGYLTPERKKPKAVVYEWHREEDRDALAKLLTELGYRAISDERWATARGVCKWVMPAIAPNGAWQGRGLQHYFDPMVNNALATLFHGCTVVDFGCGDGSYVRALNAVGTGLVVQGFDGNPQTPLMAPGCKVLDLSQPADVGVVDWVLSLEVGEHIPPECEHVFIENLNRHARKGVVLSWGVPGQPGDGHVNCRSNDYVRAKMHSLGFRSDMWTEDSLRKVAMMPWFKKTIMVFRRS